jgi:hypothetical protein
MSIDSLQARYFQSLVIVQSVGSNASGSIFDVGESKLPELTRRGSCLARGLGWATGGGKIGLPASSEMSFPSQGRAVEFSGSIHHEGCDITTSVLLLVYSVSFLASGFQ